MKLAPTIAHRLTVLPGRNLRLLGLGVSCVWMNMVLASGAVRAAALGASRPAGSRAGGTLGDRQGELTLRRGVVGHRLS